jgi:putative peptidoglycan lipid II flippase
MISRFIQLVNTEIKGLHETAYMLGILSLASSVLALLRDRLFAHIFGAGLTLDIYNAAFRIPDVLFVSVASLASAFVLIPALSSAKQKGDERSFLRTVTLIMGVLLVSTAVIVGLFMPYIMESLYPSIYELGGGNDLVLLARILLLQTIVLGFSNIAASVVQFYGRYTLFALAPIVYSAGGIFGIAILYPIFGIPGLGYGIVLGACAHLLIQLPFFIKHGLKGGYEFASYKLALKTLTMSVPRTLSLASSHMSFLAITTIAATLGTGSITLFAFGYNLQAAPLAMIGASYSVAAFPTLSKLYKSNDTDTFVSHMVTAARHIIFWSLPLTALCIVLRAHIVRIILGTGAFGWAETRITAAVLALFLLSLTAQGITLLFVRGYYAAERTLIPFVVSIATAITSVVLAFLFVSLYEQNGFARHFIHSILRLSDTDSAAVAMLALGYAVASIIGATTLVVVFSYAVKSVRYYIVRAVREGFIGAVMSGFACYVALQGLSLIVEGDTFLRLAFLGGVSGIFGLLFGALILFFIGNREVREVWHALHSTMLFKTRPTGGEDIPL